MKRRSRSLSPPLSLAQSPSCLYIVSHTHDPTDASVCHRFLSALDETQEDRLGQMLSCHKKSSSLSLQSPSLDYLQCLCVCFNPSSTDDSTHCPFAALRLLPQSFTSSSNPLSLFHSLCLPAFRNAIQALSPGEPASLMRRVCEELANSIGENLPFEFFDLIFNYGGEL